MKIRITRQHSGLGEVFRNHRLPWFRMSIRVALGLVGVMALAFPETIFASAGDPTPTIRVGSTTTRKPHPPY